MARRRGFRSSCASPSVRMRGAIPCAFHKPLTLEEYLGDAWVAATLRLFDGVMRAPAPTAFFGDERGARTAVGLRHAALTRDRRHNAFPDDPCSTAAAGRSTAIALRAAGIGPRRHRRNRGLPTIRVCVSRSRISASVAKAKAGVSSSAQFSERQTAGFFHTSGGQKKKMVGRSRLARPVCTLFWSRIRQVTGQASGAQVDKPPATRRRVLPAPAYQFRFDRGLAPAGLNPRRNLIGIFDEPPIKATKRKNRFCEPRANLRRTAAAAGSAHQGSLFLVRCAALGRLENCKRSPRAARSPLIRHRARPFCLFARARGTLIAEKANSQRDTLAHSQERFVPRAHAVAAWSWCVSRGRQSGRLISMT